jgi:hypothetical protein
MKVKWRVSSQFREYGIKCEKGIADAVNAIAKDAVNNAQAAAPRDTGTLASSIEVKKSASPGERPRAIIGSDVYYSLFQEVGTKNGIEAKRFMFKGVRKAKNGFNREMKKQLPQQ